jgi:hypothetical protein
MAERRLKIDGASRSFLNREHGGVYGPNRFKGFLTRVSDIARMSGLRHPHRIVIAGHFLAHGMPDRPRVILPACGSTR